MPSEMPRLFLARHGDTAWTDRWLHSSISAKKLLLLRRGRQTLHPISANGVTFGLPHRMGDRMRSLVCWSRLFVDREVLVAVNTDERKGLT